MSCYTINRLGQRDKLFTVYPPFDARTRPWYQAAVKAGKPIWHIYSGCFTPHLAYISASQPVYNKIHQLLGVTSVDFDLNDLSLFLSNLRINQPSQIFIIDRAGLMVAPSTQEAIFSYQNGTQQRLQALNSRYPLTRLAVQQLLLNFNELQSITTIRELVFSTEQPYFLQVMPLAPDFDLDWLLVVVIPQTAFMAQIYTQTQTTLWLLCLALGIAIVIGWLTAHWIARPILRLNQVARKLARGQWDLPVKVTREDKIDELTGSFNEMARQLKKSYEHLLNDNITLEIRVAERTHELSQALDQLKSTQSQLIIQEKMASLGILKSPTINRCNQLSVTSYQLSRRGARATMISGKRVKVIMTTIEPSRYG